ncbi:MAG: PilC/PilY family type IV pilus protein [Thiohalomonadaceae bacterium]
MKQSINQYINSILLSTSLIFSAGLAQAGITIDQTPLMVAEPVAPNIMFILDDSGSMGWEHMPGTTSSWSNGPVSGLPRTVSVNDIRLRASNINTQWYNPLLKYDPWLKHDGSSYPNADYNSDVAADPSKRSGSGTLNFKTSFTSWITLTTSSSSIKNTARLSTSTGLVSTDYQWRYSGFYYLTGNNDTNVQDYTRYDFIYGCASGTSCSTADKKWRARKVSLKSTGVDNSATLITQFDWTSYGGTVRTVEEELQNYANWFSYYRLRVTMAKAAASRVFAKLGSGYRVGLNTLNGSGTYNIPVSNDNGLFADSNKSDWFSTLFNARSSGGTPLHGALDTAGKYFSGTNSTGPYGPEAGSSQLACRQNFSILTTDGYWNSVKTSMGNIDNTNGDKITGTKGQEYQYIPSRPYMDGNSNTLADVAMHYWKTDLRKDMINNVPTTAKNPAFWQHMRTYGISIGEKGTLTPDQETLTKLANGTLSWPTPGNDRQENIDDLWHAAVNSRGEFIVASNPDEFAKALTNTLNEIASETKSEASGGVDSAELKADSKAFFSRYTSGRWDGDVIAYKIDEATGVMDQSFTLWEAEQKLPAWGNRNIYVNVSGSAKPFLYANLNGTQQGALSANLVDYLRGDRSKEENKPGGIFRTRTGLLPAFINSQLIHVGEPTQTEYFKKFSFSGASDYESYATANKTRQGIIYIAGNNGMLHAFNADTGEEIYAFMPNSAISQKLQDYAHPDYGSTQSAIKPHQYILDGELTVADAYLGGVWKTILVGTQGRGGTGVFALDVTDPEDIKFLWEKSAANNSALGNNLSKPIIAQVADGDWRVIFGNGPNSTGDKAQLITIKLSDGSINTVDTGVAGDNGLSGVALWDKDRDGLFETVYAGDLKGNIWRFTNLDSGTPGASKLFTTRSNQPISAAPLLVTNQKTDDTWVFVGTGRYLNKDDISDTNTQTWYGLIDDGSPIASHNKLMERKIEKTGDSGRTIAAGSEAEIIHHDDKNRGWFIDFTKSGERMMTSNFILGGALFGITFYPDTTDPCDPNGKSALWGINPFSGTRLNQAIFDDADKIDGVFISVLDGIPVVTSGNPPITLGDDGTFSIHLPQDTVKGHIPMGQPSRQSWREVIAP